MIFIEHVDHIITSDLCFGKDIISGLYDVARRHPNQGVLIHKKGVATNDFVKTIENYQQRSLLVSSTNLFNQELGYIEDSPFLNIKSNVVYPTWIKGTALVYLHTSLIVQLDTKIRTNKGFLYWLNSVSKLTRPLGVLCYQVPIQMPQEKLSTEDLYCFVAEHYKKRWTLLLLLNQLYYEKRFPLYAFAKAQLIKQKRLNINVNLLQESISENESEQLEYDVVIPTMGRAKYLNNVLQDLNIQSTIPNTVIIIEQNADVHLKSELDHILMLPWRFKIVHNFTHITGACRARNEAVTLSKAPWILFFDDDGRLPTNFTTALTRFIATARAKCVTFAYLQEGEEEKQKTYKQWESFGAGCSFIHRDIYEKCSYDMSLEHGYGEDVDYGMQVRNMGEDVIYAPQIQLLHLKAPVGGFRKPHLFPWQSDTVQPKPSPQIMYFRKKNFTVFQMRGYKTMQFFKTFGFFKTKNPLLHYKRFKKAWLQSLKWAARL